MVKNVEQAGSLSEVFALYKVPKSQYEELALLNNMELTDRVQAGKLIKIIGE
jgi:hypothetical protein